MMTRPIPIPYKAYAWKTVVVSRNAVVVSRMTTFVNTGNRMILIHSFLKGVSLWWILKSLRTRTIHISMIISVIRPTFITLICSMMFILSISLTKIFAINNPRYSVAIKRPWKTKEITNDCTNPYFLTKNIVREIITTLMICLRMKYDCKE